jgi:hypothetical protein
MQKENKVMITARIPENYKERLIAIGKGSLTDGIIFLVDLDILTEFSRPQIAERMKELIDYEKQRRNSMPDG